MKFSKLKRVLSAGAAAVMCVTMALSVPAAAKTDDTVWENAKALTSLRYSETYIKWAEKYSEKDSQNTITFEKSRTKKLFEKMAAVSDSDKPSFSLNIVKDDMMSCVAISGKKVKCVIYEKGDANAFAVCADSKKISMLSVKNKLKATMPTSEYDGYDKMIDSALEKFSAVAYILDDTDITDKTKGKLFKIKSGDKTYYYEEFIVDGSKFGILFDSNDDPLVMTSGKGKTYCFNFTDSVKASEFTVPKEYKEITYDNMDEFFDSLVF